MHIKELENLGNALIIVGKKKTMNPHDTIYWKT